jgi:hypothetical protein
MGRWLQKAFVLPGFAVLGLVLSTQYLSFDLFDIKTQTSRQNICN